LLSITGSPLMWCFSIKRAASMTVASGAIEMTRRVIMSETFKTATPSCRRSPEAPTLSAEPDEAKGVRPTTLINSGAGDATLICIKSNGPHLAEVPTLDENQSACTMWC